MAAGDLETPGAGWFLLLDGGILALAVLAGSSRAYGAARSRVPLPSRPALRRLLGAAATIHGLEAAYAGTGARKRGLSTWPWVLQTAVVGFPSLRLLLRQRPA